MSAGLSISLEPCSCTGNLRQAPIPPQINKGFKGRDGRRVSGELAPPLPTRPKHPRTVGQAREAMQTPTAGHKLPAYHPPGDPPPIPRGRTTTESKQPSVVSWHKTVL